VKKSIVGHPRMSFEGLAVPITGEGAIMEFRHHLEANLKRLRMPGMSFNLDLRAQESKANSMGYLEFLSLLVQDEMTNRQANNLKKRLKAAGFR
jgi:hypothetical protein